jgi:hypothetical protein
MTAPKPESIWLDQLPVEPTGWTRRMRLHLNFGSAGGSATFDIYNEKGQKVERIGNGYDTRDAGKGRSAGFFLLDGPRTGYLTWDELREIYNARYAKQDEEPRG